MFVFNRICVSCEIVYFSSRFFFYRNFLFETCLYKLFIFNISVGTFATKVLRSVCTYNVLLTS